MSDNKEDNISIDKWLEGLSKREAKILVSMLIENIGNSTHNKNLYEEFVKKVDDKYYSLK